MSLESCVRDRDDPAPDKSDFSSRDLDPAARVSTPRWMHVPRTARSEVLSLLLLAGTTMVTACQTTASATAAPSEARGRSEGADASVEVEVTPDTSRASASHTGANADAKTETSSGPSNEKDNR